MFFYTHQFKSICAVDYHFTLIYICFNDCFKIYVKPPTSSYFEFMVNVLWQLIMKNNMLKVRFKFCMPLVCQLCQSIVQFLKATRCHIINCKTCSTQEYYLLRSISNLSRQNHRIHLGLVKYTSTMIPLITTTMIRRHWLT